jgi:sulfotransferase 6B1
MSVSYTVKGWLKSGRWKYRRLVTGARWGQQALANMPAVLGNAMPKSGSHLIIQVLQGLVELGPFVNPGFPPVNRSEDNRKLPDEQVLANIRRMRCGDIGYGYVQAREPFISVLALPERATVFVYRDPRDMVVSHVFYATDMFPGHGMHQYYTETLHSTEERINAAILGVDEPGAETL